MGLAAFQQQHGQTALDLRAARLAHEAFEVRDRLGDFREMVPGLVVLHSYSDGLCVAGERGSRFARAAAHSVLRTAYTAS